LEYDIGVDADRDNALHVLVPVSYFITSPFENGPVIVKPLIVVASTVFPPDANSVLFVIVADDVFVTSVSVTFGKVYVRDAVLPLVLNDDTNPLESIHDNRLAESLKINNSVSAGATGTTPCELMFMVPVPALPLTIKVGVVVTPPSLTAYVVMARI